jgi:hypothetical protein
MLYASQSAALDAGFYLFYFDPNYYIACKAFNCLFRKNSSQQVLVSRCCIASE